MKVNEHILGYEVAPMNDADFKNSFKVSEPNCYGIKTSSGPKLIKKEVAYYSLLKKLIMF